MQGDHQTRAIEPGYLTQDVTKVPGWHGLVAWDLLFNNLTTGLFLFAAVGELASPGLLGPVARAAYPVALVLLLTDLMMLVLDLGDPLRFHHMLRIFKPSSPMSLGTWSLTIYSLPLTLIVAIEAAQALGLLPSGSIALEWVRRSAVVFGLAHIKHPWPNWRYVLMATLAGWFYGRAYQRTGKCTASALVHTGVNLSWVTLFSF